MSSDEEKKENSIWEQYKLHFTVIHADDVRWPGLAAQLHCQDRNANFVIHVHLPYFIPTDLGHFVIEEINLHRPKANRQQKDENDKWEKIILRTRIFRFDRKPTNRIVPSISSPNPSQPYAEIRWLEGAVSSIEILGLENLISRGGCIAREANRLADAVDITLSLSLDALKSWREVQKVKANDTTQDKQPTGAVSPEQIWLAQACPAAKSIGKYSRKLTNESLAEEMNLSVGTIKNRRRSFPNAWTKIQDMHGEGLQEYAEEKMVKKAK